jgi:hypothetical protein
MSRPDFIKHWTELEEPDAHSYRGDTEPMALGERPRDDNRIRYPLNEAYELTRADRWADWPARALGDHDGTPD